MSSSIREIVKNSFVEELVHNLEILERKLQEVESINWEGEVSFVSKNEKTERINERAEGDDSNENLIEIFKNFFNDIKGKNLRRKN